MAKAQLHAGNVIDGFVLEKRLHRGGMATIWKVSKPGIDVPVVMKAPFLDFDGDLSLLVGFEVEQMIMAEVKGPHVPRLVANGDFTVQPYIVMEDLESDTLYKLISDGKIEVGKAIDFAIRIGEALGDLHGQRVVHLDLKPANILFRPTGEAVLIDFGLSRHLDLPDLLEEQFHEPTGTMEYMAPEQLVRVRSDRRSDIFALGAILYQLVTGTLPFGVPSRMRQVRQRLWREPVPPRVLRPEIGPQLQEVILKCLELSPEQRYATAEELVFDLRHLDIVEMTERAERTARADWKTTFKRWLRSRARLNEIVAHAAQPPPRAPIILVAVDLRSGLDEWRHALLEAAVSVLANMPGARLACVNVMQTSLLAIDANVNAAGENIHVARLAELRRWTSPLDLPKGKVTYHLVEATSISAGILDFARSNKVDHLVVGAPQMSGALGSRQSTQIMAEAPCTVTVVRPPMVHASAGQV